MILRFVFNQMAFGLKNFELTIIVDLDFLKRRLYFFPLWNLCIIFLDFLRLLSSGFVLLDVLFQPGSVVIWSGSPGGWLNRRENNLVFSVNIWWLAFGFAVFADSPRRKFSGSGRGKICCWFVFNCFSKRFHRIDLSNKILPHFNWGFRKGNFCGFTDHQFDQITRNRAF